MATAYVIKLAGALKEKTGLQGITPEIVEAAMGQVRGKKPENKEPENKEEE